MASPGDTAEFVRRVERCLARARALDAAGSLTETRRIIERLEDMRREALEHGTVFHHGEGRLGLTRWWSGEWGVEGWGVEGSRLMDEVSDLQDWFLAHWRSFS